MSSLPSTSGIYKITCMIDQKSYIGSATDIAQRWRWHRSALRLGYHHNKHLQRAYDKYGADSFDYRVLETCKKDALIECEQYWLDTLRTYEHDKGFNIASVARASRLGEKASDETRLKMSVSHKGRRHTPQAIAKMSGCIVSVETRAKLSAKSKGRKPSPETIAKGIAANTGKTLSPEHKAALAIANIGRKQSPEQIAKSVASRKGYTHATETREKIGSANSKTYIVISPSGERLTVTNLNKFCRENGLSQSNLVNVALGKARSHKGWLCRHAD